MIGTSYMIIVFALHRFLLLHLLSRTMYCFLMDERPIHLYKGDFSVCWILIETTGLQI